ncbi:uncharacterized protein involved in exopolysaccharide biosynthesis [Bradyrhizobium elkanii]
MKFGNRVGSRRSEATEPAASWETAGVPASRSSAETTKGVLSIAGVVAFFRENGQRILMLAAVIFAVGVILLMLIPARYAATALVVVDPREQRVTTDQDVLPGIGQDAAALQSYVEIAKSDGFLGPVIEQLKVAEDSDISGGRTDPTRLLDRFRNRLDISRRGLTYVIAIKFTSNDPRRAAYYANAVAEAFVASQRGTRSVATDEAADWLKSRLKTLNDRLRSSEDAVAKFKLEHRIVNAGKESTTQQLRVTDLTQQVAAARARTEEAKVRYEQLQRDLKANVDGPVKQDLLSALRAQRSALNDQIAQKRGVLGDRHPDLVMALSQLGDLNRQIEIERKKNIDTAKSEYEAQRDQQKALEDQQKAVEQQILVDGQALVKLQELQRDADANKNIYEQFLSRYKTTDEQRRAAELADQGRIACDAAGAFDAAAASAVAGRARDRLAADVDGDRRRSWSQSEAAPDQGHSAASSGRGARTTGACRAATGAAAGIAGAGPHSQHGVAGCRQERLADPDLDDGRARSRSASSAVDREHRATSGRPRQGGAPAVG